MSMSLIISAGELIFMDISSVYPGEAVLFFFWLSNFRLAVETKGAVDTQHSATIGTGPSCGFKGQEGIHPLIPDHQKIFNKAGSVFCPVPFVQLLYPPAGKFITFVAESGIRFGQLFTAGDDTTLNTYSLVRRKYPAPGTPVFISQVCQAGPTVHSAGCDKGFVKFDRIIHEMKFKMFITIAIRTWA
jgi:hypothetical protein